MYIGMLTICFGGKPLEEIIDFAAESGIEALEIACMPGNEALDPTTVTNDRAKELAGRIADKGLKVSALANFVDPTVEDANERQAAIDALKRTVELCGIFGTDVITANAGMPPSDEVREQMIAEVMPQVWPQLGEFAQPAGVKYAFENYYGTLIKNIHHWRMVTEHIEQPNVGFNFDPSHLVWQQIDHIAAVYEFKDRIFHAHAKDVEVRQHDLRVHGCHSATDGNKGKFWRYCMPGQGDIDWGRFIGALRSIGYNGAISIEHEDDNLSHEEGFRLAARYLRPLVAG